MYKFLRFFHSSVKVLVGSHMNVHEDRFFKDAVN